MYRFDPVTQRIGAHPAVRAILMTCYALFDRLTPPPLRPDSWHVEIHQFRIETRSGHEGRPTPEDGRTGRSPVLFSQHIPSKSHKDPAALHAD